MEARAFFAMESVLLYHETEGLNFGRIVFHRGGIDLCGGFCRGGFRGKDGGEKHIGLAGGNDMADIALGGQRMNSKSEKSVQG